MYWLWEDHGIYEDPRLPVVPADERYCEPEGRELFCEPEVCELWKDLPPPSPPSRGLPSTNRHSREIWSNLQQAMQLQDLKVLLVVRATARGQVAVEHWTAGVLWA